jgi:hypothetical protein
LSKKFQASIANPIPAPIGPNYEATSEAVSYILSIVSFFSAPNADAPISNKDLPALAIEPKPIPSRFLFFISAFSIVEAPLLFLARSSAFFLAYSAAF